MNISNFPLQQRSALKWSKYLPGQEMEPGPGLQPGFATWVLWHKFFSLNTKTRDQRVAVFNFGTDRVRVLEKTSGSGSGTDRVRVLALGLWRL